MSEHSLTQSPPRLMMLEWHLTKRCNLRCSFCYIDYAQEDELSDRECLDLMDDLIRMQVPGIIFSGGEPLLRKTLLLDLMAAGKNHGMRCVLATNGVLLEAATLGQLKEAGVLIIGMSIDAATPDLHDALRGAEGAFEGVIRAVRLCVQAGVPVQVQTVASRRNWREVPAIAELCRQLGVSKYLVLDFVPTGRGASFEEALSPEQREHLLDFVYRTGKAMEGRLALEYVEPYWQRKLCQMEPDVGRPLRQRFFQGGTCMGGNAFLAVMPQGDVYPCPRLPLVAGNVRRQGFPEIWTDSPLLRSMRSTETLKGECRSCEYRDTLCDGCRARAHHAAGDYLAPDPACIKLTGRGGAPSCGSC